MLTATNELAALRKANQRLEHEVSDLRVRLAQAEHRADLDKKSARDSWRFARLTWRRRCFDLGYWSSAARRLRPSRRRQAARKER